MLAKWIEDRDIKRKRSWPKVTSLKGASNNSLGIGSSPRFGNNNQNIFLREKWWQHALRSVHLKPYCAHEEIEDQKQNDAWGCHHVLINQTCNLFARVPQFLDHLICDGFPMWECSLPCYQFLHNFYF